MQRQPFGRALIVDAIVTSFVGIVILTMPLRAGEDAKATRPWPAPEWELKDVDGKSVKLSDFKGKVVILDFWATWCGPCKLEIPGFVDLQKKYGGQGLAVIGVALDDGGPQTVKSFMKKLAVNYPVVMGGQKMMHDYGGIEAIPTTFIINRAGMIVRQHLGYGAEHEFEAEIKPLLKK